MVLFWTSEVDEAFDCLAFANPKMNKVCYKFKVSSQLSLHVTQGLKLCILVGIELVTHDRARGHPRCLGILTFVARLTDLQPCFATFFFT